MQKLKVISILSNLVLIVLLVASFLFKEVIIDKAYKLGITSQPISEPRNDIEGIVKDIEYDSDILVIGDSLIRRGDFTHNLSDYKVFNLGYCGASIAEIASNAKLIHYLTPEYIFMEGGINIIGKYNIKECKIQFENYYKIVKSEAPNAKIYIQTVLPIAEGGETQRRNNKIVSDFNAWLKDFAIENDVYLLDTFSLYESDGYLNPQYAEDAVHIKLDSYDVWYEAILDSIE